MTIPYANALFIIPLLLWAQPVDSIVKQPDSPEGSADDDTKASKLIESSRTYMSKSAPPVQPMPITKEMKYTQNTLCRQHNCINPVFPGLNDLPRLEELTWQCSQLHLLQEHMAFCHDAIQYDPALPSPEKNAVNVSDLVKAQEDAAMTMFFYHLNGMGYDGWDYRDPSSFVDNDCVRSIWKMVCYTYFPRSQAGCKAQEASPYIRPCASSCHNYRRECAIECCDESIQCTFSHTMTSPKTGEVTVLQTGYVDAEGPSAYCTGSASRSMSSPLLILLAIFALSLSLQGCDMDVPTHRIGYWRTKPNYLTEFKYAPPSGDDGKPSQSKLNSCNEIPGTDTPEKPLNQCNGRGYCKGFSLNPKTASHEKPLSFCSCERDWADPECGTQRKSQMKAFFLSVFLGFLGADYFYLGFPLWGIAKLVTFGGLGFWWLVDIVRTASGPVYAINFRTATDLPRWAALLIVITLAVAVGFLVAIENFLVYRRKKRADVMNFNNKEESRSWKLNSEEELERIEGPRYRHPGVQNFQKRPNFAGYGAALPVPVPVRTPYATDVNSSFGPAGMHGQGSPTPPAYGVAPTHMQCLGREGMMPRRDDNIANVDVAQHA